MLPNVPHFAVCYYGVLRTGAVVVPMNVLLKRREVAFYLQRFRREAAVRLARVRRGCAGRRGRGRHASACSSLRANSSTTVGAANPINGVADTDDSDTAVILYTSGTTGTPKGAELTHANLARNAEVARALFGLGSDAVTLGALPLFHSFGQTCGMNATVAAGGTLTLIPRFDPAKALEIIERDRVNIFQGVPTMYGAILHLPDRDRYDTSTLQVCVSGGSAMPVELLRGFEQAFGMQGARGLWPVGDITGGFVQSP